MPVVLFIENKKDFTEADKEKRDILKLYREDIMKINAQYRSKVLEGSYAEQYEETFFWLSDAMISNECFLCSDPNVGLSLNETRTYVKCLCGNVVSPWKA